MRALAALVGLVLLMMGGAAMAQDQIQDQTHDREIAALTAVLAEGPLDSTLFSPDFLKAVPPAQLEPTIAGLIQTIGPVVAVRHVSGASYVVETASHEMPADIALDGEGRIAGLFFRPAVARNMSIEAILDELAAVAPHSALLVTENGVERYARDADTPLAVGSAFKLGVLQALKAQIEAGAHGWDEVAELAQGDISLPSGMLQGWPVGAPLTLHTLAALMISISDNTATDALMRIVGREAVEAALGVAPALTTRELFVLKADRARMARYQAGDLDARRAVLAELAALPLPAGGLTPHDEGAEWYVSPRKLCALIEAVGGLDVTQINPGVANKADWASVAFKGGSEIGVLNLTTQLVARDGTRYCVAASWNDGKAIEEAKAMAAYASLLALLARE